MSIYDEDAPQPTQPPQAEAVCVCGHPKDVHAFYRNDTSACFHGKSKKSLCDCREYVPATRPAPVTEAEERSLMAEVGASQRLAGFCPGPDNCQNRIAYLAEKCGDYSGKLHAAEAALAAANARAGEAESRIRLAKQALIQQGYFKADELNDDIAPRITELASYMEAERDALAALKEPALELCWEIEKLPASELQTKISVMASELFKKLPAHIGAPKRRTGNIKSEEEG